MPQNEIQKGKNLQKTLGQIKNKNLNIFVKWKQGGSGSSASFTLQTITMEFQEITNECSLLEMCF